MDFWELLLKLLEEEDCIEDNNGYFAPELCKECKGKKCCQHFPCMNSPKDFKFLVDSELSDDEKTQKMLDIMRTGMYSIDTAMGWDREYGPLNPVTKEPDIVKISSNAGYLFVRARAKGHPIFDSQLLFPEPIPECPCINWSFESGCKLEVGEDEEYRRPFTGRMLKPVVIPTSSGEPYRRCSSMCDTSEVIMLWIEYQYILWKTYCLLKEEKLE